MSSISSVTTALPPYLRGAETTAPIANARTGDSAASALPDATSIADLFSSLGLSGMRAPGSAGASSIAIAEVMLALDRTMGEARGRRAVLQAAAAGVAAGAFNPLLFFQRVEETRLTVTARETEKGTKETRRGELQGDADTLDGQIASQTQAVEDAEQALASAGSDEAKATARTALNAARTTLGTLQGARSEITGQISAIDGEIAALATEIHSLRQSIATDLAAGDQLVALSQLVAIAITSVGRNQANARDIDAAGEALRLDALFAAVLETAETSNEPSEGTQADRDGEAAAQKRTEVLAAALRNAIVDLLTALSDIDPDAIAHPPEQTGRSRLRFEA
ncbi:hypothetical protein SAMN05192530_102196 [Aureimonas jatrophae]|uniref:Uncharacterized protein n=2 Tax=Aureimonas jatrophae TaxID=1166073 RepID=A0A1H0ES84_9HYPH|nr:hypothetical protein SAMN05192530_102196 [Aureimonas jatrophae]